MKYAYFSSSFQLVPGLKYTEWWAKLEKDGKVRHNIMTQIARVLAAVVTVFIGLWTLFTSQGGGVIAATVDCAWI